MSEPTRLLIVEDLEDDAILLVRKLRRAGFEIVWERVQTAATLREALGRSVWDAIVSDFRMPAFTAPEALEIFKESGLDIPFIVVSGTISDTLAAELMKAGAHGFVPKANMNRLSEVLRRELRETEIRVERKWADLEFRRTRERLELALEGARIGTWDWDIKTRAVRIDDRYAEILGYSREDLEPMSIETFRKYTRAEDLPEIFARLDPHLRGETDSHECEFRMRHRSGRWVWILGRGKMVEWDANGKPLRMVGTHLDITDRKRAEIRSNLQNLILGRIARLEPLPNIFDALVRTVESQFEGGIGSILLCDPSGKFRHGAAPSLPDAYSRAIDGMPVGPEAGSCGTAAFRREVVVAADISTDPLWRDFRHLALEHGLRSCWSAPAIGKNDEVLATFALYFKEIRAPEKEESDILTLGADIAKIAIERHRAESKIAKRDRYLSALVDIQQQLLATSIHLETYQTILDRLGAVVEADRAYIFENRADETGQLFMSQRAEWCAPGVEPQIDNPRLQNLSYAESFPRWEEVLKTGAIVGGTVAEFPESERSILEPQDIRSILILPLIFKGDFFGFIGFDNCASVKHWDSLEIGVLSSVAAAIALAREREKAAESLARLNRELEDRVKRRTAELRDSEGKLQAMLNFAPSVVYVKDLRGRFTFVNRAFLELFNCAPEDIIGKTDSMLFPADIAGQFERNDRIVLRERRFRQYEEKVRIGETIKTFLSNKFVLFDGAREPYAICGISTDISDRRAFEDALKRSEERTRGTLMAIPDLVFRLDRAGRYVDIAPSPRVTNLVDSEIAIGRSIDDLLPPDIARTYCRALKTALATQTVIEFEQDIRFDGELRYEEVRVAPCGTDEAVFLVRDISDRKRVQIALRQSNERFQRFATHIPGALYQYELSRDGSQQFIYMSDRVREITGLDAETIRQNADRLFALFDPEDLSSLRTSIARSAETLTQWSWEGEFTTPEGERKWMHGISQPERQADGDIIWDGVILDVTERKLMENRLQTTIAELNRATRLKDEFLANMSHELRTPLNSILGMSEALRESVFGALNEDQLQAIATVENSGKHLLALINDILDLSKIGAGKLELNLAETSIRELCQTGFTFVKQLAFKKQISLSADIPRDLENLALRIDQRRMCQVLINLLANAVKFTPAGGKITLGVRLETETSEVRPSAPHRICFSVTDTGIGIAPEHLENLFQPFVQVDSSLNRQYEGTGLGLALVKQIAELHGGRVGVASQPGKGSCFTVYLPYWGTPIPGTKGTATVSESRPSAPSPSPVGKSPLILVAEDNEANIFTLSQYLKARGYRLVTARDGGEAVEMARSHLPDLVLMDIQMPVMDGLDAIREIRRDPRVKDVPIVVLTALVMGGDREKCLRAGADEFLSKPVKLKQLSNLLPQLIAGGGGGRGAQEEDKP